MNKPFPPPGLQLIVFGKTRDFSKTEEIESVLTRVAEIGYASVEMGAAHPEFLRRTLEKNHLTHAGTHVVISSNIDRKKMIQEMAVTGARDVCNSGLLKWGNLTADDYRESIKVLNTLGRELHREGISFHYHNHEFEFARVDGNQTGMDLLLEGLDFSVIDLCVDIGWVDRAGLNPAQFLKDHADRIGYLHLKDHDGTDWTELGRGRVDFGSCDFTGLPRLRHVVVEQDSTKIDPFESIRISREFLRNNYRI